MPYLIVMQLWGGIFYLLNKVFFSWAERAPSVEKKRSWRIWSWVVYIIGLPPWIILLIPRENWMVVAVEIGGAPAMFLGLVLAIHGVQKNTKWTKRLDNFARFSAVAGLGISLWDIGFFTRFTQVLELGTSVGYLFGTILLAKQRSSGYFWFMLMNASTAWLTWELGFEWLALQQVISLGFIIDAWYIERRTMKTQII
ncbi:MAG: hypothetical protein Q7R86_01600 [bacterium]|nr:hypothetical protein [bacterium]